jgi:hypothetical protein
MWGNRGVIGPQQTLNNYCIEGAAASQVFLWMGKAARPAESDYKQGEKQDAGSGFKQKLIRKRR